MGRSAEVQLVCVSKGRRLIFFVPTRPDRTDWNRLIAVNEEPTAQVSVFSARASASSTSTAGDDVADLHPYKVAAKQFAINREVEQRAITKAAAFIEM